ncbi:MAG: endonuclease III domain-containing protein, partial [Planctomycetota bacterium]
GAILTQNTNWTNVEKAIKNLKAAGKLGTHEIHQLSEAELAQLIRPSGFFNVKAKRVKTFINWLFSRYKGDLAYLFDRELQTLREEL